MRKKATSSVYQYQQAKVPCTCTGCRDLCGPAGQLIPNYTRRKHREKDGMAAIKGKGKRTYDVTDAVPFEKTQAFKKLRIGKPGNDEERVLDSGTGAGSSAGTSTDLHDQTALPERDRREERVFLPEANLPQFYATLPEVSLPQDYVPLPERNLLEDYAAYPEVDLLEDYASFSEARFSPPLDQFDFNEPFQVLAPLEPNLPGSAAPAAPRQPENTPDIPHQIVFELPQQPSEVLNEATTHWFWRIILILTAWLNLHYHVPHRACVLLLKVLRVIFIGLGQLNRNDHVPVTLTTTFRRLNLSDEFYIHPTCPTCHSLYPADSPISLKCSKCDIPLFKFWNAIPGSEKTPRTSPLLQCPRRPISEQLSQLLNRPGMVEAVEQWRMRVPKPGFKTEIMDGEIWKTLPGHDGKLFFDNSEDRANKEELRIGLTLGFDGYVLIDYIFHADFLSRFGYKNSRQASSHSSGALSCLIANLPTHLKYVYIFTLS
jgi:hypothetical protein